MKRKRHSKILKLISEMPIQTQEQLTDILKNDGFSVTQATVSRDIKELGLIKVSSADGGYKYAQGKNVNEEDQNINVFSQAVVSVEYALHTVVVKTYVGMAQGVAASLDSLLEGQTLGSIAGDDTILLITKSEEAASQLVPKLEKLFGN